MSLEKDARSPYDADPGLREIIVQFVDTLETEAPRLSESLARKDFPEFVRLTHRLKGSAKVLGFELLGNIFGKLEDLGRDALSASGDGQTHFCPQARDAELKEGLAQMIELFLAMKAHYSQGD